MNYNVRLALWWSLFENASASLRSGDVLSAYLYLVTKRQSVVGFVQGVNGILQLLAAIPAGVLADRHRRDAILRAGAAVGLLAGLWMGWVLVYNPSVWALTSAMALFGCYRGVYASALEALFADSVARGRSGPWTWRYITMLSASSIGPWVSIALFAMLGNKWHTHDCRMVLVAGLLLMLPALVLMCLFDDGKALEPHHEQQQQQQQQQQQCSNGSTSASTEGQCAAPDDVAHGLDSPGQAALDSGTLRPMGQGRAGRFVCHPGVVVTVLIAVSDLIGSLASGMTLKFFGLFFLEACHMRPIGVSVLGAVSPLAIAVASHCTQRTSKLVGRVQISLVTRLLDIVLLLTLAHLASAPGSARNVLVAVHLTRMAAANCTRGLMRSVLMDNVAKRYRGQVNALESVRMFSWSGSAALGGWLIERYGFSQTFFITAGLKIFAFLPLTLLLAYVPDGVFAGRRLDGGESQMHPAGAGYERLAADEEADGDLATTSTNGTVGGHPHEMNGLFPPGVPKADAR